MGRLFLKCANLGVPFQLTEGAFKIGRDLISANSNYIYEHNLPIVGFQNPRTPVSFSDPGLIEHYFKTTNKSYVISTAIKSFERYKSFYTDDEISFFFQEMALFIQNNNLGKFSLGNGRWVNIFDMLLQDGPWSAIIESLLNKIDFHELEAAKIENFWNDDITQFSLVMGRYPNLATEVYENHNVKLSMMLQESIALDMADIYRRMYRFGTKKAHGWTKDHAVFAELQTKIFQKEPQPNSKEISVI